MEQVVLLTMSMSIFFDEQLLLIGEDGAKWGKDEKTAFIVKWSMLG